MILNTKAPELLRVATMNTLNTDDNYLERFESIIVEAATKNVDVLLLQEMLGVHHSNALRILEKHGFMYNILADTNHQKKSEAYVSGNGVASRIEFTSHKIIPFTYQKKLLKAVSIQLFYNGKEVHLISTHNCWGGDKGNVRLSQTVALNDYAVKMKKRNPESVIILGGDFNEEPASESMRFLRGESSTLSIDSAFWVDVTHGTNLETAPTTRPYGYWGIKTAAIVNIVSPAQIPERRIDYMFVHGWVYGKVGYPSNTERFGVTVTDSGLELSDHYGIVSDIWVPKN